MSLIVFVLGAFFVIEENVVFIAIILGRQWEPAIRTNVTYLIIFLRTVSVGIIILSSSFKLLYVVCSGVTLYCHSAIMPSWDTHLSQHAKQLLA